MWSVPGAPRSVDAHRRDLAVAIAGLKQTKGVDEYRRAIDELVAEFFAARARGDCAAALTLAQLLAGHEPPGGAACRTIYEFAVVIALQTQAACAIAEHRQALALDCVEASWTLLGHLAFRWRELPECSILSSDLRHGLLGTLASAKWNAADPEHSRVLDPEKMVAEWHSYAERFRESCARHACTGPLQVQGENLLWSGLWIAACAWRWCEVLAFSVVNEVNRIHRRHFTGRNCLAHSEFYFRSSAPVDEQSPLFWQYEICKAEIEGVVRRGRPSHAKVRPEELRSLLGNLLEATKLSQHSDGCFQRTLARQIDSLTPGLSRQDELLNQTILKSTTLQA